MKPRIYRMPIGRPLRARLRPFQALVKDSANNLPKSQILPSIVLTYLFYMGMDPNPDRKLLSHWRFHGKMNRRVVTFY